MENNDVLANQSQQNCMQTQISKTCAPFKEIQNGNFPSMHSRVLVSQPSPIEFAPNMVQCLSKEHAVPKPIIVMPAMLSLKQKPTVAHRAKFIQNPQLIESKIIRGGEEKEHNIHVRKVIAPMKTTIINNGINYYKPGLDVSQGQRLLDLKKDREKQFFRNKGLADIRLLSQANVPGRLKKQK